MPDDPVEMAALAKRCRRLAQWCSGPTKASMNIMADDFEAREKAAKLLREKPSGD
jgi:hypothetical protein